MSDIKPMFESIRCHHCRQQKDGLHYSIGKVLYGIESLKALFPNGEANDLNFVLFSTSGVHGTYTTLEDIEESIKKYGFESPSDEVYETSDDYHYPEVTVLVVHPRVVALRYGCCKIDSLEDLEYLKKLRASSTAVVQQIGYNETRHPL
jgi:hypothetical protein